MPKLTKKHKWLIVTSMVCIALIMASYGSTFNFFSGGIFGGFPLSGVDPSASPSSSPFYTPGGGYYFTPTPTPTRTPTSTPTPTITPTPEPTPTGQEDQEYLYLYMSPNPATQRDEVLGEVWSSFSNVEVIVHYIDGVQYNEAVTLLPDGYGNGYGTFNIVFKTGSYLFWVTYGSLTSNYVTLVVTA
jgi:hypothetical protein